MKEHFNFEEFFSLFKQNQVSTIATISVFAFIYFLINSIKFRHPVNNVFPCSWFLLNGVIFHGLLDGLVGYFHYPKPLEYIYFLVDSRYRQEEIVAMTVCLLEIFFMIPGCLTIVYLYKFGPKFCLLREYLLIIVCMLQSTGSMFFMYDEWKERGMRDVCRESCWSLDLQNLVFFWGAFVLAGVVWNIVPLFLIVRSYRLVGNHLQMGSNLGKKQ